MVPKNCGYSLVETMIGLAIGALALGVVHRTVQKMQVGTSIEVNRKVAASGNRYLLDVIKRDFGFKASFTLEEHGRTLTITRKNRYAVGEPEGTYVVTFKAFCATIPNRPDSIKDGLTKIYSGINSSIFKGTPNGCIASMACTSSQYPMVTITAPAPSPKVSAYSKQKFPQLTQTLTTDSMGTGLCMELVQDKIRFSVESVYGLDRASGRVLVLSDEIILSQDPTTTVELLAR